MQQIRTQLSNRFSKFSHPFDKSITQIELARKHSRGLLKLLEHVFFFNIICFQR